uniref:COMM domain-containing protein 1 n=1 Tax=Callorhinchus milii TaxID=7868 RepID=A0A4W3GKK1_CALMI
VKGALQSIASADMDFNQLEAFLTAQTKKQRGITPEQATVLTKFWKNHKLKIRESLVNQSRWENSLKSLSWRVDLKSQSRHLDQINAPVAIVELELGKSDQLNPVVSTAMLGWRRWAVMTLHLLFWASPVLSQEQ